MRDCSHTSHLRLISIVLAVCGWIMAHSAQADEAPKPAQIGASNSGLCGLVHASAPRCIPGFVVASDASYGLFEKIGTVPGVHHQTSGSLGAAWAAQRWFAAGLRLDGRMEFHPDDGDGPDRTAAGEPRVFLRAGDSINDRISLGAEARIWLLGAEAPSLQLDATTVDLKALLGFTPPESPWSLFANLGFRLDNSEKVAPDLDRLRPGDRASLGLSEANAVLVALGAAYTLENLVLFGELSADVLVGARAPELLDSPIRLALGTRYALGPKLQLEASLLASLSKQPSIAVNAPLVPMEARAALSVGIRYGALSIEAPKAPEAAPDPARETTPAAPTHATVEGVTQDADGAGVPDVRVRIVAEEYEKGTVTDADGVYRFENVPLGPATLSASAPGFAETSWAATVGADQPTLEPQMLTAMAADSGMLRSLVRSFASEPLAEVKLTVRDARRRVVARGKTDEDGRYQVALKPGSYEVTVEAAGYQRQRRKVRVSLNEVTILNVDLHGNP